MVLSLAVADPVAFVADDTSPAIVSQGVATFAGVDVSNVTVSLSVVWRRLSVARSLAGIVAADASIAVEDIDAANLLATDFASIEPTALASSVNEALASAGKADTVSVTEISVPVIGNPAPPTEEVAEANIEDHMKWHEERESSDAEQGESCTMRLVILASAVMGMLVLAAVACLVLKKVRRWRVWPAHQERSYTKSDDNETASEVGGEHLAHADADVAAKIVSDEDDDLKSEFSTIAPSDTASIASPQSQV